MTIIFIGGGSAGGKTGFSVRLRNRIQETGQTAQVIKMDDYYHEIPRNYTINVPDTFIDTYLAKPENAEKTRQDAIVQHYREHANFDREEAYDYPLLTEHLMALNGGEEAHLPVRKPIFDFATNTRNAYEDCNRTDVVIVEGLFAISFMQKLRYAGIHKISVYVGPDSYFNMLRRRVARDFQILGDTEAEVMQKERTKVGPGFFNIIAHNRHNIDIEVSNNTRTETFDPLEAGITEVLDTLREYRLANQLDNHGV